MGQVRDTASFIAAGIARFGTQYDYCDAVYKNADKKIRIYCKLHDFPEPLDVTSQVHLGKKGGCKLCKSNAIKARCGKSTEQFIADAKAIHGDRFDYVRTEYINARTDVTIYCKEHENFFQQKPDVHLRGRSGCKACKGKAISLANRTMYEERRIAYSEFLAEARARHGERYTYDESSYHSYSKDVTIICAKHGAFPQRAARHAAGAGCSRCADEGLQISQEDWAARIAIRFPAIQASLLEAWQGFDTEVHAQCSLHPNRGTWTLTARSLLNGNGCMYCERLRKDAPLIEKLLKENPDIPEELRASENLGFLEYVAAAVKKHGQKYRYLEDGFQSFSRPCVLACPFHTTFVVFPSNHLAGDGCLLCEQKQKFIEASSTSFPQVYDYSDVDFFERSMGQFVRLRCQHHNVSFEQRARAHLDGRLKCTQCREDRTKIMLEERRAARAPQLVEQFQQKARDIHGDKYAYPQLEIELFGLTSHITVVCNRHGRASYPTVAAHLGLHSNREPQGCQSCKGEKARLRLRKAYQQVKGLLAEKGFELLEDAASYLSMGAKASMRCIDGHVNDLVPQKIVSGHGCPDCPTYTGEAISKSVLEELFNIQFKKHWFRKKDHPDLLGDYHHLEVDGYAQSLQLAFEYQGVYHRSRKVHPNDESYQKQLKRDETTAIICKNLMIKLVVIEEFSYPFSAENVRQQINAGLRAAGVTKILNINEEFDLQKHIPLINRSGLKKLHALAQRQNLIALDKQWFGELHSYNWRCKACGHEFRSPYSVRIAAKHDCCSKCARGKQEVVLQATNTRHERFANSYLANLGERAAMLGLTLLDKQWQGSKDHIYTFRCAFNEELVIERTYNNLQKWESGCNCPQHRLMKHDGALNCDSGTTSGSILTQRD